MNADEIEFQEDITIRRAQVTDAEEIAALVNSAYRGDSSRAGWTTEADLLEGPRTDAAEIRELIASPDSVFLLGLASGELVASINIQRLRDAAYLGMIVTRPVLQGRGMGKRMIAAAENFALSEWGLAKARMTVITIRRELMQFYERRGYARTGKVIPLPDRAGAEKHMVANIELEYLEKALVH
jgi:GNAT superfamily N-acetyltransferase